jgi:hypothetical protein
MLREDWDFVSLVIDEKEEVVDLFFEDVHVRNTPPGAAPQGFKTLLGLRTKQLETTPRIQGSIQTRNRDSVSFQIRILVSNYFHEIQEFQCKER